MFLDKKNGNGIWTDIIEFSLIESTSVYIAIFNLDGDQLFANKIMQSKLMGIPKKRLLNPTFDFLKSLKNKTDLIFSGYITLGDYESMNIAIDSKVYRRNDQFLIIGEVNTNELINQNNIISSMNRDINILHRQLIKEKKSINQAYDKLAILNETIEQNLYQKEALLEELSVSEEKLKRHITEKDKFFSIIAHDLKSPFNGFLGLTKLMSENINDFSITELQTISKSMQSSAINLYRLLENLLEWASMQHGMIKPNQELCMLSLIVNQIVDVHLEVANQKNIKLINKINKDVHATADFPMLNTILRNLISNAIKFTPKGGEIEICVNSQFEDESKICIYIKDNGIGMDANMIKKLFMIDQKISRPGT
jgi:signal transduction histidine kinase